MREIKGKHIIAFFEVLICCLTSAGSAAATEISVSNSAGTVADFTSIQAAIDAADPGDRIIVKPGTYRESIAVNKDLTIVSESGNPFDTIVRAGDGSEDIFSVESNGVSIKGFSIRGAKYAGIHLFGVTECKITDNELSNNGCGIDLYMFSSGNMLEGNNISDSVTGISLGDGWHNTLSNNTVAYCSSGISLFDSCNNTLQNNSILENNEGISLIGEANCNILTGNKLYSSKKVGLHLYGTTGNAIYDNCFNNSANVEFESESVSGTNIWNITRTPGTNIVGGPYIGGNFWANPEDNVYFEGVKDTDDDGIFDEQYDIESSGFIDYLPLKEPKPETITVSMDNGQDADFTSIQAAIDNASPGDIVVLRPGTYNESVNVYVTNLTLTSESGSSENTSIQAANSSNDALNVTADGVTISRLNITGPFSSPNAGIHLNGVKNCRIENNQLSGNNSSSSEGYGIRLDYSSSNILSNNTLSDSEVPILLQNSTQNVLDNNSASNSSCGVWVNSSSNNTLNGNNASDNGIGIFLQASNGNILSNSTVLNNTATGINLLSSSENILKNSLASDNKVSIVLRNSCRNQFNSNMVSDSVYGIWIYSLSNDNKLIDNRVSNSKFGIHLNKSIGNTLIGNTLLNCTGLGISYNHLSGNMTNMNTWYGICLGFSTGNLLNGNSIVSNSEHGLYCLSSEYGSSYNDYLNNKKNDYFAGEKPGFSLNMTRTMGKNISWGSYLEGTFWATPESRGFSQAVIDENNCVYAVQLKP